MHEPKNVQVILGRSITINCQADGFPKPKIVWKRASMGLPTETGELPPESTVQASEFRDILANYRYQVFSNGSLYLQESEVADSGWYMCQVSNQVGTDLSKVVQIQVQQPPRVETKFASETVVRGQTATLQCRAQGDAVLRAEWNRDMAKLDPSSSNQRYTIKEEVQRGRIASYLEIGNTQRLDSALFTCVVSNGYGADSTNIQLIVQGRVSRMQRGRF